VPVPFGDIGTISPSSTSSRSSSRINPTSTMRTTSATLKRRRGRPSAREVGAFMS
jgi:hypothetical protein